MHLIRAETVGDYPPAAARKSAWQFLNKTNDPRLLMPRKFTSAIGVKLSAVVKE